jgi:hypothetical protein
MEGVLEFAAFGRPAKLRSFDAILAEGIARQQKAKNVMGTSISATSSLITSTTKAMGSPQPPPPSALNDTASEMQTAVSEDVLDTQSIYSLGGR